MCGRYLLDLPGSTLASYLDARGGVMDIEPRWNAAPSQELPIISWDREEGVRILEAARWGLIPTWKRRRDLAGGSRAAVSGRPPINARAETVLERPTFRQAAELGRVLVPVTGFYEWKHSEEGPKVPYLLRVRGDAIDPASGDGLGRPAAPHDHVAPFTLAGIATVWVDESGVPEVTYAVLTTRPNEVAAEVHDRMPVILDADDAQRWLEAPASMAADLVASLGPFPAERTESWAISTLVNDVGNDTPELVRPA